MGKKTLTQRVVNYLGEVGYEEADSPSRKYRKFVRKDRPGAFLWVGKAGAVRCGRTSSQSISVTSSTHKLMKLHEAKKKKGE